MQRAKIRGRRLVSKHNSIELCVYFRCCSNIILYVVLFVPCHKTLWQTLTSQRAKVCSGNFLAILCELCLKQRIIFSKIVIRADLRRNDGAILIISFRLLQPKQMLFMCSPVSSGEYVPPCDTSSLK